MEGGLMKLAREKNHIVQKVRNRQKQHISNVSLLTQKTAKCQEEKEHIQE